ncbi:MAG: hypothetical protein IT555_19530 [Acetobacteraceae bacterium]|nr:hypothetical protein [Acetobacteraceae bacterium]
MAAGGTTTITLEENEVALIIGEEEGAMSVRVVSATEVEDGADEIGAAPEIVLALAMRLLKDPEFHDEVLEWYYAQDDDDDEDEK